MPGFNFTADLCNYNYYFLVDCGAPIPASMVIIEPYVNTTRGSLITYHCDDGLIPNNTITATCQNDGQWSPDPSRHVCRLPTAGSMFVHLYLLTCTLYFNIFQLSVEILPLPLMVPLLCTLAQ